MSTYAVWLDGEQARIFKFAPNRLEHVNLRYTTHEHHGKDLAGEYHRRYYKHIAEKVADASMLILMGPGLTKNHFRKFLEESHGHLARRVVGFETVDHPSDHQIIERARRYIEVTDFKMTPL